LERRCLSWVDREIARGILAAFKSCGSVPLSSCSGNSRGRIGQPAASTLSLTAPRMVVLSVSPQYTYHNQLERPGVLFWGVRYSKRATVFACVTPHAARARGPHASHALISAGILAKSTYLLVFTRLLTAGMIAVPASEQDRSRVNVRAVDRDL